METKNRRRLGGALILFAVVPLVVASAAWACARLATLQLDRTAARPGTQVAAFGTNYSNSPAASDVTIRLNSRSGPVLWQGRANQDSTISGSLTVPSVRSGHYTLVATQNGPTGTPAAGTPGRAALRVKGARKSRSAKRGEHVPPALWASQKPQPPAGPSAAPAGQSIPAAPVSLGGLLLAALLAGSGVLLIVTGRRGTRHMPAARPLR